MPCDVSVCTPEEIERGTVFMREIAEAKRDGGRKQDVDAAEPVLKPEIGAQRSEQDPDADFVTNPPNGPSR